MRSLATLFLVLIVTACGGGGGGGGGSDDVGGGPDPVPDPGPPPPPVPGDVSAAVLAAKMGRANRLLVGLGDTDLIDLQRQSLAIDIHERYLPDSGPGDFSWLDFSSADDPQGAYVNDVGAEADAAGAVPMFTLYGMAMSGDGNLATLDSQPLMQYYWSHVVLAFDRMAVYNKPVLVNFEPDFWGYVHGETGGDPTQRFAWVKVTPDCSNLPNNVVGVAQCLMKIARTHAPKALVGFPPADFSFGTPAVVDFMNRIHAQDADFIVQQTMDRDAGCYELKSAAGNCDQRIERNPYWNQAAFNTHFAETLQFHQGIGGLPIIWWQTPLGVASSSSGSTLHFRDNRVEYFLTHPEQLVAVGGVAVVFSAGQSQQTNINTDGHQFQDRLNGYLANPEALPITP